MEELLAYLVESAAGAGSSGRGRPLEAVVAALRRGRRAARHGRCLPLPPLLDLWALLDSPLGLPPFPERSSRGCELMRRYDRWILELFQTITTLQVRPPAVLGQMGSNPGADGLLDCMPLLVKLWPHLESDKNTACWRRAYERLLAAPDLQREIHQRWQGERRTEHQFWEQYWQNHDPGTSSPAGKLWSLFASGHTPALFPERFDHHGAWVYLRAQDPPLRPAQQTKIQRLQVLRPRLESPLPESYEVISPAFGVPPLSAYVAEDLDYVAYCLVNRVYHPITSHLPSHPPLELTVHLSWWPGVASLGQGLLVNRGAPKARGGKTKTITVPRASLLQGLVALLLEDWREAFKDLPVRYCLHRRGSTGRPTPLIPGGPRWKPVLAGEQAGAYPEGHVIRQLFTRPDYVEVCRARPPWRLASSPGNSPHHLGVGVIWEDELWELGFHRPAGPALGPAVLCGPRDSLDESFSLLLVLAPPRAGRVYRLDVTGGGKGEMRLLPLPGVSAATDQDLSFAALRLQAIDALLHFMTLKLK